jgi:VWFA-related protein
MLLLLIPSGARQPGRSHPTAAHGGAMVEISKKTPAFIRQKTDGQDFETQLIQVTTVVTGKNGEYVEDLRPKDFAITEDGVAMKLLSADHYHAGNPKPSAKLEKELRIFHLASGLDRESVRLLLFDHRIIVLYFDMSTLSRPELERAVEASTQFVRERMTAADLVSVVSFGAGFAAHANFTNDRTVLESALASLVTLKQSMSRSIKIPPCAKDVETCEVFKPGLEGQPDPNEQKNDLDALFELVVQLRELPGRKSIVHFTGIVPPANDDFLWHFIANVGNLGVTALYEVDMHARANRSGEAGDAMTATGQPRALADAQEELASLAHESGGAFYSGVSDFGQIFQRVQRDSEDYYLLSYNSPNTMEDCNFPKVSVKLEGPSGADISFRPILAARESPPPFEITLLAGYHHCTELGIDSAVGLISKTGGLHISYDIIDMDVDFKSKCDWCEWNKGQIWRRDQTINGHQAIFILMQNNEPKQVKQIVDGKTVFVLEENITKRLTAIFPDAHTSFSAPIQSEDQMADMLLMVSTFKSAVPTH